MINNPTIYTPNNNQKQNQYQYPVRILPSTNFNYAEEKKKKQVEEEERVISVKSKTGTPEGWVEPMGPSSETSAASKEPKGKKNKFIGKAEIKNDKKDDE